MAFFTLQSKDIYKIKVSFTHSGIASGSAACFVVPIDYVCDGLTETDKWYKEQHEDGEFSLYVLDSAGEKYYVHDVHGGCDYTTTHFECSKTAEPRRFIIEDGKIRVRHSPSYMYMGIAKWFIGYNIFSEEIFVDNDTKKKYIALPVFAHADLPLELRESAFRRRMALLEYYKRTRGDYE